MDKFNRQVARSSLEEIQNVTAMEYIKRIEKNRKKKQKREIKKGNKSPNKIQRCRSPNKIWKVKEGTFEKKKNNNSQDHNVKSRSKNRCDRFQSG